MPGKRCAAAVAEISSTGRTGGRHGGGDGVLCVAVAQRHLSRDVEQLPARRPFEVAPAAPGQERHFDVVRLGIAETEDACVALGAGALVTRRPRRLEDQRRPSPGGPGPTRSRARGDRRRSQCICRLSGTPAIIRNGRSRASPAKGVAVRSASVTSGMDVSTHTVHDAIPSPGDQREAVGRRGAVRRAGRTRSRRQGPAHRRLPPGGSRLLHGARHRPVVARLVGPPFVGADVRLR